MSFQTIEAAIRGRFRTEIEVGEGLTGRVRYDNQRFTIPTQQIWVGFSVLNGGSGQSTFGEPGANRFRNEGIAIASVYVPFEGGTKDSLDLIDAIVAAFRAVTADGVVYRVPSVERLGRVNNVWWQTNVSVPWYSDEAA